MSATIYQDCNIMGMIIFDDEQMFRDEVKSRGGNMVFPLLKTFTLPHDFDQATIKAFLESHKVDVTDSVVLMTEHKLFINDLPSIIVKVWTPPIV